MKLLHVVGARPNFVKLAPITRALRQLAPEVQQLVVHTGQHYDDRMSQAFFRDLEIPPADFNLGVGSGSHADQTARVMLALEPALLQQQPDWVLVVGDVNSTLAATLTAAKLGLKVAHVEAGLRSLDRTMPEEINRVVTDHLADLLFTTEPAANENLAREGIPPERCHLVGNVMIDTLVMSLAKTPERWPSLRQNIPSLPYLLATIHRPATTESPENLEQILLALGDLAQERPVLFPLHPRTRQRISDYGLPLDTPNLKFMDPLGYLDFLTLLQHASAVITDSGGIQEETTYLGVPCLTVRPNTERPITISHGTNRLVTGEREAVVSATRAALQHAATHPPPPPPDLWDGHAAERIADIMLRTRAGKP